jgi:hypothetical protein
MRPAIAASQKGKHFWDAAARHAFVARWPWY